MFVAVRAKPVSRVVVPFVLKANSNAVLVEGPQLFDESIIEFWPIFGVERDNRLAPLKELGAISPAAVFGISSRHPLRIARIPSIFGHADFLLCRFQREWWRRWTLSHKCLQLGSGRSRGRLQRAIVDPES